MLHYGRAARDDERDAVANNMQFNLNEFRCGALTRWPNTISDLSVDIVVVLVGHQSDVFLCEETRDGEKRSRQHELSDPGGRRAFFHSGE